MEISYSLLRVNVGVWVKNKTECSSKTLEMYKEVLHFLGLLKRETQHKLDMPVNSRSHMHINRLYQRDMGPLWASGWKSESLYVHWKLVSLKKDLKIELPPVEGNKI